MNRFYILFSILVLLLAIGCTAVIAHASSLTVEPMLSGYLGVLLPVLLCICAFLAGLCYGAANTYPEGETP
jgi:protein-S-isoprenylcysteine O-methyltransferase Ste14